MTDQERDARRFLETLFEGQPSGMVIAVGGFRSPRFVLTPEAALGYVVGRRDVYARITLLAGKPAKGRGTAADSAVLPGVWAELDVNGGPRASGGIVTSGAPSVEAAIEATQCLLEPTLIVLSGYGVHSYHLFEEPWILGSELERQAAAELVEGWQARLRREFPFELDSTHDLARVLRVPGSLNGKAEAPAPVVLASDRGPRYSVEEIGQLAVRPQRRPSPATKASGGRSPEDLLHAYPKLTKIAKHQGKAPGDGSGHSWDWMLVCQARRTVKPPISEAEAVTLLAHARALHPDPNGKGERANYLETTVSKAFAEVGDNVPVTPEATNAAPPAPYIETATGLLWNKRTNTGVERVRLANFTARIVTDTTLDYGSGETRHIFTIQARLLKGVTCELELLASAYAGMKWVHELGADAILWPGQGVADRTRHAIQELSEPQARRVYGHTGWIKLNGDDVYLHAGGGIGPHGPVTDIEVRLPEQLEPFELPTADPSELGECIRASLELLTLGPFEATAPLLCSAYRAPLGPVDLTTHGNGPTGAYKTELAAFAQQHYGAGFDSRHLPGSWSSTANFTADLLYVAKDALVVIDDFAPTGSKHNVAQLHRDAERVIRGQGNHSARGRMNADGSTRPSRPPRGLILSTGEDVPGQQSLRARIVVVDHHGDAIDVNKLTSAQAMGAEGMFAKAMAAFLQWLAARGVDRVRRHVIERTRRLRESVVAGEHKRSAANLAQLAVGMEIFLEFASESGAISVDDAGVTWEACWLALMRTAATQSQHQRETNPARLFLSYLSGAIISGHAYLDGVDGDPPDQNAKGWGWRDDHPAPGADRIGWVKDDDVYLDPRASYRSAQRFADTSAQPLSHQKLALHKMLLDENLITVGSEQESRHTVRRTLGGVPKRRVLLLTPAAVSAIQGDDDTSGRAPRQHDPEFPPIPPMTSINRPTNAG